MARLIKFFNNLGNQILLSLIFGGVAGFLMKDNASFFLPLGLIFINLIKMLVIPLIVVALIAGVMSLNNQPTQAGKVGLSTLILFVLTSLFAAISALCAAFIFKPGNGIDIALFQNTLTTQYADKGETPSILDTLLGLVPENIFIAFYDTNILQILLFSAFLGFGFNSLAEVRRTPIFETLQSLLDALIWMIKKVMLLAPIGVFALTADAIGTFGFSALFILIKLFLVYALMILFFALIVFPVCVQLFGKNSAKEFIIAMRKPQAVAFSTASSLATVPVTLETCQKDLKISKATSAFVIPLGATINMAGSAIYYILVAYFFAELFQIELHFTACIAMLLTATLGSIGQAGVPGPTFLVVAVLLAAGIPIEGLPLLFALDRIFDMLRTYLNVTGDAACASILDKNLFPKKAFAQDKSIGVDVDS